MDGLTTSDLSPFFLGDVELSSVCVLSFTGHRICYPLTVRMYVALAADLATGCLAFLGAAGRELAGYISLTPRVYMHRDISPL